MAVSRAELLDRLPRAANEYRDVTRDNANPYLLLRSDHASEWEKEQAMFEEYPGVIADHGFIPTLDIFVDIAVWTLGSNAGLNIRNLATNTSANVEWHTGAAYVASDPETGIEHLTQLDGIGSTAATGLYAFFDPTAYSPMDSFALRALRHYDLDVPTETADGRYYAEYCRQCRDLSADSDVSILQDVGRALRAIGQKLTDGTSP